MSNIARSGFAEKTTISLISAIPAKVLKTGRKTVSWAICPVQKCPEWSIFLYFPVILAVSDISQNQHFLYFWRTMNKLRFWEIPEPVLTEMAEMSELTRNDL